MDLLLLGSILMFGDLLAFGDVFSGSDSEEEPQEPENPQGGPGDDLMTAEDGETIAGWDGNDDLTLTGDSRGYGNNGDDSIHSNSADAEALGSTGNDTLDGSDNLAAHGDDGNDDLLISSGGAGWGGAGDDLLTHAANDAETFGKSLYGGAGNDSILGTSADTALDGGAGNDLFVIEHVAHDNNNSLHIDLAEGDDTVLLDPNAIFASDAAGGANQVVLQILRQMITSSSVTIA